ncbi:hypothetical protein B0H14DRAFT_3582156 [Mycena olivaceomarginata]|nr:hypothetical protein B0H14DRAFT_3582156 [Mycena olivaceomarginata]
MNVKDVVRQYLAARRAAFKAETIVQSWAKSGIDKDPKTGGAKCNPSHFTAADFAPSNSTSTQLQLPNGYPARPASPSSPSESSSSESGSDDVDDSSPSEGDDWQDVTTARPPRHHPTVPSSSVVASAAAVPSATSTPPSLPVPVFTNIYDDSDSELDDDPPANMPMPAQIAHYQARNRKLKEQRTRARQQRDEAASHAILAGDYAKTLKGQLNSKKNTARGTSGRIVHTQSRILTTAEGRAAAAMQKDARDERDAAAVQRQTKKDDAAAASRARRAELTAVRMSFTGSFKQLKLGELQDLAWALGLDEKGTKSVLLERAQAHFELPSNDALRNDPRYVALFGKRKRGRGDGSADDEPVAGPSTSQRSPPRPRAQAAVYAPPYNPFPPPHPPPNFHLHPLYLPRIPPYSPPIDPSLFYHHPHSSSQ